MSVVPSAAPEKPYVFISYARGDNYDRHLARQLDEALRIRKIEVFRDQSSLEIGDVWPDKLQNALARATHFVVFLSAEARQSRWVNYEIDAAVARPREELRIVGIRRSTSAEFPQLANIEVRLCEYGQELETVFRVFGMPWEEDG
ncbi:MAG: toll/interleukin-1 receptor domain-containing protein, partial [Thermoanaerobaculia bacterium]